MTIALLLCSFILLVCIAFSRLSSKFGIPALLIFLTLGMVFGSDGLFKIPFDNYRFAEQICSVALIFIMFYGGFGTNWKAARPVAAKAAALSTLGVVITALITALFCHFVLHFEALESFLIGSVISSTDAASVFSILRSKKLSLKDGADSLLEVESGSNDPASYLLTITAMSLIRGGKLQDVALTVITQLVFGVLIGLIVARLAVFLLKHVKLLNEGFDMLFVLAVAVLSYSLSTWLGGNGYLSVYLAGILLGNSDIPHRRPLVHFFDGVTGLAQIAIFFLLGLLAFPSQLPSILLPSIAIALFLTFVARPVAVFSILAPTRYPFKQQLLVSWAGLRGAASIVFAIMATVGGAAPTQDLFHIVFCVALLSVTFQGTLLPVFARRLDLVDRKGNVLKTFNDYQEQAEWQLIKSYVPDNHPWVGKRINELTIPIDTRIVMISRGGHAVIPKGHTLIQADDTLVLSGELYRDDNTVELQEIPIFKGHKWAGEKIRDLHLPAQVLILLIKTSDGSTRLPKGKTTIAEGDTLVLGIWEEHPDTVSPA